MARQYYDTGHALLQQGRYHEALLELGRAENTYRALDARGHPFSRSLPNGISGLADTLRLSGLCRQKLGDHKTAITCYETSYINIKFEKKRVLGRFLREMEADLASCYERVLEAVPGEEQDRLLQNEPSIDVSFRFPFSLSPAQIPFARLYELEPDRHAGFRTFYEHARERDVEIRRRSKTADESTMKKMSIAVWSILFMIWAVYIVIFFDALLRNKR
jgi:tetratricopeptide (TPR) repeat protein